MGEPCEMADNLNELRLTTDGRQAGRGWQRPNKSLDAATPEMKGPAKGEHPPTQQMDKAVPEMKSGGTATGMSSGAKAEPSGL